MEFLGLFRRKNELGGGAILDLGGYPIQLAQWVFERPPMKIKATGKVNEDGVDYRVKMKLIYDDNENQVAELNATTKEQWDNGAVVVGTKGQIKVNNIFLINKTNITLINYFFVPFS